MVQALLHLWGDYILQSHWMATKKVDSSGEGYLACFIHCFLYTLPFLTITQSPLQLFVIFGTHFLIDKYRLARYVNIFKNMGFKKHVYTQEEIFISNHTGIPPRGPIDPVFHNTPTGYPEKTPDWLAVWLLFITDNTLHITINYLTLTYL